MEFKTSFNLLYLKLDQMCPTVEDNGQRVLSLELASDNLSQWVKDCEDTCATLHEDNSNLNAKLKSRFQNICILGLRESIEEGLSQNSFRTRCVRCLGMRHNQLHQKSLLGSQALGQ